MIKERHDERSVVRPPYPGSHAYAHRAIWYRLWVISGLVDYILPQKELEDFTYGIGTWLPNTMFKQFLQKNFNHHFLLGKSYENHRKACRVFG